MKKTYTLITLVAIIAVFAFAMTSDAFAKKVTCDELMANLKSEKLHERCQAAQKLVSNNMTEAVNPLLECLKCEKDMRVKIVFLSALSELGNADIVSELETLREKETNKTVQHVMEGVIKKLKA